MNSKMMQFYKELQNKEVSFIGLGRSHSALLEIFVHHGAKVTLRDKRTPQEIGQDTCAMLENKGITLRLGEGYLNQLEDSHMVLRTPGVSYTMPELEDARKNGTAVTSEIELFFDLCPCKIYGITGSDGKTTTSSVLAQMLDFQGFRVFLGGNIGFPLLPRIDDITAQDIAVVELSSFQLISMRRSPDVAIVTNISPNHLDVHKNMDEYIEAKKNILLHQNGLSRTVLNADNEITASFVPCVRGETMTFSRRTPVRRGAFLSDDGCIYVADKKGITKLFHKDQILIPGDHSIENYLAAISAAWEQVSLETILHVAQTFPGVEHRIEFVRELNGARWYNDSIASSPTRTIACLDSFGQKIILIAGGYDKKIPFLPLAPKILEKVKVLILMGNTAQKIQDTVENFSGYSRERLPILRVENMEQAVAAAKKVATAGDVVSLSPACAAFDLYKDFEARGCDYKSILLEQS